MTHRICIIYIYIHSYIQKYICVYTFIRRLWLCRQTMFQGVVKCQLKWRHVEPGHCYGRHRLVYTIPTKKKGSHPLSYLSKQSTKVLTSVKVLMYVPYLRTHGSVEYQYGWVTFDRSRMWTFKRWWWWWW